MTAYGSRLERFAAWCEREDIDAFAADVRTIRRYLAENGLFCQAAKAKSIFSIKYSAFITWQSYTLGVLL